MTQASLPKNSMTTFRQSGYQCDSCKEYVLTFGNEIAPIACPNCLVVGQMKLIWDHMVTTKTVVTDVVKGDFIVADNAPVDPAVV